VKKPIEKLHFTIARDEGGLTVLPDHPSVREFLTLQYREMIKSRGRTRFETISEPMFELMSVEGRAALLSHQGFWKVLQAHLQELGHSVDVQDLRPNVLGPPNFLAALPGLRQFQRRWIMNALMCGNSGLIGAPTRFGKCVRPDTLILMYDGSLKEARHIVPGDLVMGPDSRPRTVASVCAGRDQMYRITPNKGDAWDCTQDHLLSLQCTGGAKFGGHKSGDILHVTVRDYLTRSKTFKHCFKQYQTGVEFPSAAVPYDPYVVGAWLGDGGHGSPALTKPDAPELTDYLIAWADSVGADCSDAHLDSLGLHLFSGRTWHKNPVLDMVRWLRMTVEHRAVPRSYLINDRRTRLQLLAGLLDTDGYLANHKNIEIVSKYDQLAVDILFLARSLGFRVTTRRKKGTIKSSGFVGWYHRMFISGDLSEIPLKVARKWKGMTRQPRVNFLRTGFKVTALGEGDYAGFTLGEDDARFVLGNFTVTHNSYGMSAICKAFPKAVTVVAAPGVDLCKQLFAHFKEALPHRDIKGVYTGSRNTKQSDEITICSIDSLNKMDPDITELLLVDEPHAVVSEERMPKVTAFVRARKYGFGATLNGRFDKKDRLIEGIIGPVISNVTYREAVAWKAISPLKVIFVKIPFSKDTVPGRNVDRAVVYQRLLTESSRTAALIKKIVDDAIPTDWQTMAFIQNERQAEFYLEHAMPPWGTIAMAKRLTDKERDEVTRGIAEGRIIRVLASNIYVQGLTFPDLKVVLNLAGGGANTTAIQKPGRLLQIRPNKNYGVMFDFMFECRDSELETRGNPPYSGIVGEGWARHKAYADIGYDIEFVTTSERAREIVLGAYDQTAVSAASAN
jgi:Hom_end-associated Hint/Homing endonuclease